jgi:IS5 family transposase
MLCLHYLQQWLGPPDPAMLEAPHDVPLDREVAKLGESVRRLLDETTILRLRYRLWHSSRRPGT